jgi:hypothetical protein
MTIWYIDPSISPGAESDSYIGEFGTGKLRDAWSDVSWANGDSGYQARGTTYTGEIFIGGGKTNCTVGAYGTGALPKVFGGTARWSVRPAAGSTGTTVQDLECYGAAGNGSQTTHGVYWGSGGTADCHDGTLQRCVIHSPASWSGGDCNGVTVFGNNMTVKDCTVYDCPDDGVWILGTTPTVRGNTIHSVGGGVRNSGDCIQLTGASGEFLVYQNYLDHSSVLEKQVFIIAGAAAGSGGQFYDNVAIMAYDLAGAGGSACVYSDQPGAKIFRNTILGGTYGVQLDAGAGQQVYSNVISGAYIGLTVANAPTGMLVQHNTFADCSNTGAYMASNDATSYARQNVFLRCVRGLASNAAINKSKNAYFGNTVYDWAAIGGGGSIEGDAITADPLLRGSDYRPIRSSPLLGAGADLGIVLDRRGLARANPPAVGAHDAGSVYSSGGLRLRFPIR